MEQLIVNLTDRAAYDLGTTSVLTGYSKTDVVNRAIQAYAHLERVWSAGSSVYVRNTVTDELEELVIF